MRFLIIFIFSIISFHGFADDTNTAKKNILDNMSAGISSALENFIGGEGDTEVQIVTGEDYHPVDGVRHVR